jgi:hypothetical protein
MEIKAITKAINTLLKNIQDNLHPVPSAPLRESFQY